MKKTLSLFLVTIMVLSLLVSCGGSGSIVGNWSMSDSGIEMIYEFKSDGTGAVSASGVSLDFTYSTDGDAITLTLMGVESTGTYSINGDELTITIEGEEQVLTKVNS